MAICAMNLEIETYRGKAPTASGNDAGMTGAKFKCCRVPIDEALIGQGKYHTPM